MSQMLERVRFDGAAGPLYARVAGPRDGEPVVLLHGFPEFWYGWRKQIEPLAATGFRVVALDQRGYNESVKPREVRAYALPELRADVAAVIAQLGGRACVAGHDWGGIVAWEVALHYPELVRRMAILNAPHPAVARKYLTGDPRQMLRSWYIGFFQLPMLPERLFQKVGLRNLGAAAKTDDDRAMYRAAWAQPRAMTSMIHWYRALARYHKGSDGEVRVPTRIVWGMQDPFLLAEMARDSLAFCLGGQMIPVAATHWVQHEQPERVNELLIEWFCTRDPQPGI